MRVPPRWRWLAAWAALTGAFALHVLDEATHDFLAWYNPAATSVRMRLGGSAFPPSFTFETWLLGLVVAIVLLSTLTPLVRPERRWLVPIAYVYAAIHLLNGLGHLGLSLVGGWFMPGALSSPVLLAAALWLLAETRRVHISLGRGREPLVAALNGSSALKRS